LLRTFQDKAVINSLSSTHVTVIKPSTSRIKVGLADIWAYRELLYFLTLRDIKIRYKQTAIGIAWAVLQPVLTTAIFTILFSRFAGINVTVPYPVFALSGLTLWLFVHSAVSMASNSYVGHTNLITKIYFPRLIVPISAVLASLFDLVFGFAILAVLMIYYGAIPTSHIVLAPLFVVLSFLVAASLGILFAALNIRFRDVKFALPFLLQVWMIASPIFYPADLVPDRWRIFFALNPLTGILEGFRSSLFGTTFDWTTIGVSCLAMVVIAALSLFVFSSMEDGFADVI